MKTEIKHIAAAAKISDIGFCSAAAYATEAEKLPPPPSMASADIEARTYPTLSLKDAKSVIVCLFNYYSGGQSGNISRYAQGLDYHTVAVQKMQAIIEYLIKKGYRGIAFSDTGSLNERLLFRLAGLGVIGKNQCAISNKLGSWCFIGYIVTDCELEPDLPKMGKCTGCGRCAEVCPLGAISENGFDEKKCLSYITQKKGELTEEEAAAVKATGKIWGCDLCQEVCPHNSGVHTTDIAEFRDDLVSKLYIDEALTNREFKSKYEERAFSWRGKSVLIRNQKIVYNK